MSKPIAVISGDIHYNLQNLELADKATRAAIAMANKLQVPFIANGDTHDTKANLRGECVNAMIETFKTADIKPYVSIGNHCKISAKGLAHSLNFLQPYANIVDTPRYVEELDSYIIPYHDAVKELRAYLSGIKPYSRLILHQGLSTGLPGEYIVDHSALDPEDLKDFRSILSHYHARQDIVCGRPRKGAVGLASFVGSPYTTTFAEANDPPKGFQILMSDGTLEFVPTNLRQHVVIEVNILPEGAGKLRLIAKGASEGLNNEDLVWVKISGASDELSKLTKGYIADALDIKQAFRLDLIPTDQVSIQTPAIQLTQPALLNHLIDNIQNTGDDRKTRLKDLWQTLTKAD